MNNDFRDFDFQSVFYMSGVISLLWCLVWFVLATDDPADNRFTSKDEVKLILDKRAVDRSEVSDRYVLT